MTDGANRVVGDLRTPDLVLNAAAPLESAREFITRKYTEKGLRSLHHQDGCFFVWKGSHYGECSVDEIRSSLYRFLENAFCMREEKLAPFNPNKSKVANVLEAVAAEAQLSTHHAAPVWLDGRTAPHPADLVAFSNVLLDFKTRETLAHTPAFFGLNALPYAYDPTPAQPESWLVFLNSLWQEDQESINTLQEMFGLFLTCETHHQKAFLIIGPKRSGKGTIARVLMELLGKTNVCGPTLGGLEQNFGLSTLIGKRLAIISDARLSGRADQQIIVERLLAITGEDSLTIDRKFRDSLTCRLQTRFLILTNEIPRLSDASGALASRFVTLTLKQTFYGREDPLLTDRLLDELPGILNWALDGWARLAKRKHFIMPASSRAVHEEMEDLGSPIGAFLRECCDTGPGLSVPARRVFERWSLWCKSQGRDHIGNAQSFGRDLRAAVPELEVQQPRANDGMRIRCYSGLRLRV